MIGGLEPSVSLLALLLVCFPPFPVRPLCDVLLAENGHTSNGGVPRRKSQSTSRQKARSSAPIGSSGDEQRRRFYE